MKQEVLQDITERFEEFYRNVYRDEISETIGAGSRSLPVDFSVLQRFDTELADFILESGEKGLEAATEGLHRLHGVDSTLIPRFTKFPESEKVRVRDLRTKHLGRLLAIEGLIKRASEVRPEILSAIFRCAACRAEFTVEQTSTAVKAPTSCACGERRFDLIEKVLVDVQIVSIEESPESLSGTEQPGRLTIFLREDLVDPDFQKRVVPGNKVLVVGVLKEVAMKKTAKRYELVMESNNIDPTEVQYEDINISEEEEKRILKLSKDKKLMEKLVGSIAPSLYGHEEVKRAILFQLFSGVRKARPDGVVTRGDMHILLIGEPGTGKSMLIKFVTNMAPKARYVVGKSSSAAGITAAVVRDEVSDGFALEAGALVLANGGICGVDEIDKMDQGDRSSMHEAMEQQTITVSKANIHTTLQTRTSILAAGNPKLGRFDAYDSIASQINIEESLLSRFDLIFPIRDIPNKEADTRLAEHILSLHRNPKAMESPLDLDFLKKYIAYARRNIKPKLSQEASDVIRDFYIGIRSKASAKENEEVRVPIAARQLEALVRISESGARAQLKQVVDKHDAQMAIDVLTHCLKEVGMDPETGEFDIDRIESGMTSTTRGKIRTLMDIIVSLSSEAKGPVSIEDVKAAAEEKGIKDSDEIIRKLKREGELFEPKHGYIQKI